LQCPYLSKTAFKIWKSQKALYLSKTTYFIKKIDKGKPASISFWWIYTAMGYKDFLASTPQMTASKHKKENYKTKKEN